MKSPLRHLRRSPNKKKKSKKVVVVDALPQNANVNAISLGVGEFPTDGEITFNPSSNSIATPPRKDTADTVESTTDYARKSSTFMRMADLEVLATDLSPVKEQQSSERHYDHPSVDPPPGVDRDPKERWVALDTGTGTGGSNHAPVAPYAVDALCMGGYNSAMNPTMWKADKKTEKTLRECQEWSSLAWSKGGAARRWHHRRDRLMSCPSWFGPVNSSTGFMVRHMHASLLAHQIRLQIARFTLLTFSILHIMK